MDMMVVIIVTCWLRLARRLRFTSWLWLRLWLTRWLGCAVLIDVNRVALSNTFTPVFIPLEISWARALEINQVNSEFTAMITAVLLRCTAVRNASDTNGIFIDTVARHELMIVAVEEVLNALHHFFSRQLRLIWHPADAVVNNH